MLNLVSWNVNGLRACMGKGFMDFLNDSDYDIVALQETKMQPEQADFSFPGYYSYWNSAEKKGYSGTLVLSKEEPVSVRYGMEGFPQHNNEGRVIALEYGKFFLVNVYTPNAQHGLARLPYRMEWEDCFREWLGAFDKPVVVCGDLNVAHKEIDLKNPKSNKNNAGFSPQEREKFSQLLESGFVDTFRHLYPDKTGAYSWWSYMGKARENNSGWRIDYFLVSTALAAAINDAYIMPQVMGSDHCPVGLTLKEI